MPGWPRGQILWSQPRPYSSWPRPRPPEFLASFSWILASWPWRFASSYQPRNNAYRCLDAIYSQEQSRRVAGYLDIVTESRPCDVLKTEQFRVSPEFSMFSCCFYVASVAVNVLVAYTQRNKCIFYCLGSCKCTSCPVCHVPNSACCSCALMSSRTNKVIDWLMSSGHCLSGSCVCRPVFCISGTSVLQKWVNNKTKSCTNVGHFAGGTYFLLVQWLLIKQLLTMTTCHIL